LFWNVPFRSILIRITGGKAPPRVVPHNENIKMCNLNQYDHIFFLHRFKVQRKKTFFPHESLSYYCIKRVLKSRGKEERENRRKNKIKCRNKKMTSREVEKGSNEEQQRKK